MINITNKTACTGCGSCASACPKKCIEMRRDEEGFLYPDVNKSICTNCGICVKKCPLSPEAEKDVSNKSPKAFAARSKNEAFRQKSSSGGIFSELASYVLKSGGVVFGACLNEKAEVAHTYIESETDLIKLQGSKYVQSIIGDSYIKAEEFLNAGRTVLFSGTPCQIGGLNAYLKKNYPNLYEVDLICHGVPSPLVWEKYKESVKNANSSPVESISFRDKTNGWRNYFISIKLKNGKTLSHPSKDNRYMNLFLRDLCLRPSCYDCKFKTMSRNSDITLADFWGVNKTAPELDDNKGTSLVIVHSQKGAEIINKIKNNVDIKEVDTSESIAHNPSMIKSASLPKSRSSFMKDIMKNDFDYASKKYLKKSFLGKLKRIISQKIKKIKK